MSKSKRILDSLVWGSYSSMWTAHPILANKPTAANSHRERFIKGPWGQDPVASFGVTNYRHSTNAIATKLLFSIVVSK